ncbi:hypothetical protein D3C80_1171850 [compost metagenome]
MLPLCKVLDALGDGCNHSAAQDAARDQPPHRQEASLYLPHPHDHGGDIGQGRQAAGAHAGKTADGSLLDAVAIDARRHVLPLLCKTPTGIVGANGLGTSDRVHQQSLPLVAAQHLLCQQGAKTPLRDIPQQQGHGQQQGIHPADRASNDGDKRQKQDGKGQVHQCEHHAGTEELPYGIQPAHLGRQGAQTAWLLIQAQMQQVLEDLLRDALVDRAGEAVQDPGPGDLQQPIQQDDQHHAGHQCGQGRIGQGGHDTVVDLHGENGGTDRQQVHQHCGHHDFPQPATLTKQFTPDQASRQVARQ